MNAQRALEHTVIGLCIVMIAIVTLQSYRPFRYTTPTPPVVEEPCIGAPIAVTVPFTGAVNDPWTCQVQCADDKPRYILYTNGKATQCETPPGCNDYGEDHGTTCALPAATNRASKSSR